MTKKNLKKLLNLNFTEISNKTYLVGEYDLPYVAAKITNILIISLFIKTKAIISEQTERASLFTITTMLLTDFAVFGTQFTMTLKSGKISIVIVLPV